MAETSDALKNLQTTLDQFAVAIANMPTQRMTKHLKLKGRCPHCATPDAGFEQWWVTNGVSPSYNGGPAYVWGVYSCKPVREENEAKGYARGENDYVLLTDDDLDAVALDTVKTINIEKFVPSDSIEWVYLEKPHYLMPDNPVGQEAFAVIRDAMADDNVVGISKLVIGRRERAVVLEPRGNGIVLWTLRYGDEVRPEHDYFADIDEKGDPDLIPLVQQLIKKKAARWSPTMVSDPIQGSLLNLIAGKKKALRPAKKATKERAKKAPGSNVVNIMDALKKSVAAELRGRKNG